MSNVSVETRISELSAKVDSLILVHKISAFALLLLSSLINIGETLSIIVFRRIFATDFPGQALPYVTLFLLQFQGVATGLAFLWPVLGLLSIFIFKTRPSYEGRQ